MTSLYLEQLLSNKKSSCFVLVKDTIRLSALPILTDIGKRALTEDKTLIVLLTETSPSFWRQQFSPLKQKNIFIIDAYTDPNGWNEPSTLENCVQVRDINNMEKLILSPIIKKTMETPNCTLLIDSLAPLAMISQHRTYQLVKALESLTTDAIRLIVGFHSDIKYISKTGLNMQDSLDRLASVIIRLESLKERTHFEAHAALTGFVPQDVFSYLTVTSNCVSKGGIAHIEWRKKSGKVTYESNGFILDGEFLEVVPTSQLTGTVEETVDESQEDAMQLDPKMDPTANLSFNLSLTDEQRKQKEDLVLPYIKAQQFEVSMDEEKKTGLIYYDPDAADDFDDEDPDDDLDI